MFSLASSSFSAAFPALLAAAMVRKKTGNTLARLALQLQTTILSANEAEN